MMKRSRADLRPRAGAGAGAGAVAEDTDPGGREATDGSETVTSGPGCQRRFSDGSGPFIVTKRSRKVRIYSMKMTSLLLVLSLVLTAMSALRSTVSTSTSQPSSSVLFVSAFSPSSRSPCHGGHKIKDRIRPPPYRTLSLSSIEDGNNNNNKKKRLSSKNTFLMFQPTSSTSTDNEPRRSFRIHYFFSSSSSSSSSVNDDDDDDENDDIGRDDNENMDADDDESVAAAVGQNEDDSPNVATTTEQKSSQSSSSSNDSDSTSRQRIRRRVRQLAKSVVLRPLALATTVPVPSAIAAVLKEASVAAVEQVEDAITQQDQSRKSSGSNKASESATGKKLQTISSAGNRGSGGGGDENDDGDSTLSTTEMIESIIDEAFAPMELSLQEMETSLVKARAALDTAKQQSYEAMEALQVAAEAQAQGAAEAVAQVEKAAQRQVMVDIYESSGAASTIAASSSSSSLSSSPAGTTDMIDDISKLTFDDVDYDSSEMAPPFLDPDSCLVPGEPVIRVEKAPENSRRIFAGIDIMASVDDVWNVLTKYNELQNVIPNLVVNDVLELYDGVSAVGDVNDLDDENIPEEVKCKDLAEQMKGSLLKQIGGAKVAGINFSARTTLEVREWPNGMPDFAHFRDDMYEGKSRETRAREYPKVKLKRYRFPRPFALSRLPTRDISMQSIVEDDGEFRLYQGVWRMQPLPGCAPPGKQAMRLTYAVEISPRAYLPVKLVEGRIVKDLATNLLAIRNAVTD